MKNLIVRCSSLHLMMTSPTSDKLPETTKTWLKKLAKESVFGYRPVLETPQMTKGTDYEFISLELLNKVNFTNWEKNEKRITNDWLSGEPDVVLDDEIPDVKTSWSLETFPAFKEDANKSVKKSGYEWQLRGYMLLFEKPKSSIRYAMISTPESLLKDWEDRSIHKVDHIPPSQRVSSVFFERDLNVESKMKSRYELCNEYYQERINELKNK